MLYLWLALFAVFVIAEMATVNLVSIWFAAGSLAALLAAVLRLQFWLQAALFLVVSGVVLAFVRPLAKKYINPLRKATNADRVLGVVCPVTEDIDNIAGTGTVAVGGKIWTARSSGGEPIDAGTLVRPISIQGVKLIVEPVTVPAEKQEVHHA